MASTRITTLLGTSFIAGGILIKTCLYNVDAGQAAVIYDRFAGVKAAPTAEGTHFIIPIIQRPIIFDIRTRPRTIKTVTGSRDLQKVELQLRILFRPRVSSLPKLYMEYGEDYDEKIFLSIGNEVLKSIVAQFDADQLITQREMVSNRVQHALRIRSEEFNVILEDISITHLSFSKEYQQAVEMKQVEQQRAERARFLVEKAEQEQLADIVRAEGESKAAQMMSEALKTHGLAYLELKKMEAAIDMAETLANNNNVSYLPTKGTKMLINPQI